MSDLIKTILCITPFAVVAIIYAISEFSDMFAYRKFLAEVDSRVANKRYESPAQRRARLGVK